MMFNPITNEIRDNERVEDYDYKIKNKIKRFDVTNIVEKLNKER